MLQRIMLAASLVTGVLLVGGTAYVIFRSEGAAEPGSPAATTETAATTDSEAFLETLSVRTFRFFWDQANPSTFLIPDRFPTRSFDSIGATGFGLTAYPIGVERGYVTRDEAARRTLDTLRFLWTAPQDSTVSGATGYRGFFYHFLEPETGHRFGNVELSTVDTALLLAGALFCQSYFDRSTPDEEAIRTLTDRLFARVDWTWASVRPPTISHGWKPESGFLPYDWRGYNEAMLVYILALASPTHPVGKDAWDAWTSDYRWGEFHGEEHVGWGPLFVHQYTHAWVDLRDIQDGVMREHGIDYFENSRRAVRAQHAYAVQNPAGWSAYGDDLWGLTACDGPVHLELSYGGEKRQFHTYWARGASFTGVDDDGTVCPSAAGGSIPFAPQLAMRTLQSMAATYGDNIFSTYGFLDALNPSFTFDVEVQHGRVDPELGWFDTDYLGIDQGAILAMLENHRSGLVWRVMRTNGHLRRGLERAGFTGGWLDAEAGAP